jgi:hypothetical protein
MSVTAGFGRFRMVRCAQGILAAILLGSPTLAGAADVGALMKDLLAVSGENGHLTESVWLPRELWQASAEASDSASARRQLQYVLKAMEPYEVIAVVDGEQTIGGAMQFMEDDAIRKAVTIEDSKGNLLHAVDEKTLPSEMAGMFRVMRPMFVNVVGGGGLGEHVVLLAFPATAKDGQRILDPKRDGVLLVHVGDNTLRYQLPLATMLPPMTDPETGASFPGNYRFNPFTGRKLEPAPAKP